MPYHAKTIVVGSGNILFKDDGYGPIVVNLLEKYFENETEDDFDPMVISYIENDFSKDVLKEVEDIVGDVELSGEVKFIDAGNGATHFIFSLPDEYWEKVIVVDVVDYDAEPGSVRTFSPFEMPRDKYENVHTYAVEEPLHELSEKCEVVIVGCKPGEITTPTVDMGLTEEVEKSVPDAIRLILNEIKCPVFVIGGQKDKVTTGEACEEIAEKLGCNIYMYENLGHAMYEEAQDFTEMIYDFFID